MQIKLLNTLTKRVYYIDNLVENPNSTDFFYCFDIKLPDDIVEGEYILTLYNDGYKVAESVAQVGDYTPDNTTYNNKEEDAFVVYEG